MNKLQLSFSALSKLVVGLGIIGLLLFLPAGSWHYWHAWLLIALLFIPMMCMGIWLLLSSPELLSKRLNNKEKEQTQKHVVTLSGLMFIGGFLLCGFDYRFAWSQVPVWVVVTASVSFLIGYILYAEVLRENAYLSRTIEVQDDQQLIDTGLYGIVRHPMYTATLLMFLSMPLILGSWWALALFAIYPLLIIKRIRNEEQVLTSGLEGYADYQQRVRWRLIPWVW
ncbi:MAG: isoprenylcysteine carboxylmethyltransferase family protein [Paludibacteraceae bacterium]|nr:isoprenylcysteine carboxylmethyltransferase family protein [Paludibacteraceae bacterium]